MMNIYERSENDYTIEWTITGDRGTIPIQEVWEVWKDIFGRDTAYGDEACFFVVTDNKTGDKAGVDLYEEKEKEVTPEKG